VGREALNSEVEPELMERERVPPALRVESEARGQPQEQNRTPQRPSQGPSSRLWLTAFASN